MDMPFDTSVVCPVLIGREAFLASFERVFVQVKSGQGQIMLVSGEAGIGKSRFVSEARSRVELEQVHFLQGYCFELDRSLPFAPLLDLLRSLLLSDSREATSNRARSCSPIAVRRSIRRSLTSYPRWIGSGLRWSAPSPPMRFRPCYGRFFS